MNKIKIFFYILIIFISFTINSYSSEVELSNTSQMNDRRLACKTFFDSLSKSENNEVRNFYTYDIWVFSHLSSSGL